MSLVIHQATLKDLDFIMSLITNGARKGHFSKDVLSDKAYVRKNIHSIVCKQISDKGNRSEAWIAKENNRKIGAVIMRYRHVGDVELEFIAVDKSFKTKGFGSMILDHILSTYLELHSLVALCFEESSHLKHMLIKRGFEVVGQVSGGDVLTHPKRIRSLMDKRFAPSFMLQI